MSFATSPGAVTPAIRVLIIGETRLYREGLASLLNQHGGIEAAGLAADWNVCMLALADRLPNVLLIDIAACGSHEFIRGITVNWPDAHIVAIGVPDTEDEAISCAEAGCCGYVARESSLAELVQAVESAANDELLCSPRIARAFARRISKMARQGAHPTPRDRLTSRESQVGDLLALGFSNKQIAGKLHLSESTVKQHVHHLLEKLNVQRRAQAAALLRGAI